MTKALILLSGGLDSAVVLAMALANQRECLTVSFDYQQKHRQELVAAKTIANHYQVPHQIISIDPSPFSTSSLVSSLEVPKAKQAKDITQKGISNTYVPGRNTLFLAYAMSLCESFSLDEIHFGPSRADETCYPDCRSNYIQAMQNVFTQANQRGLEGNSICLITPLMEMDKKEIIQVGLELKVPLDLTWSCYSPTIDNLPCRECLACLVRQEAYNSLI